MQPTTLEAYQLLHNGILALAEAERHGMCCDVDYCTKMIAHINRQVSRIQERVFESDFVKLWKKKYRGNFNFNSNDQLVDILFTEMGYIPIKTTAGGKPSADEESLEAIPLPELQQLLEAKKLTKAKDTYLQGFLNEQVDGVIHTNFNLHLAKSYRPSTDSPNLANVPNRNPLIKKLVRKAIKPSPGHKLICADFKGIEVSVAYCVTGDTVIETIDGRRTILEIIASLPTTPVYVYGYDFEKGRICVNKVLEGGLTKKHVKVFEVTLDNGEKVKTTIDHKFLLRNGEYKELKDLTVGESLMPFYKKNKKSSWGTVYSRIYLNNGQSILAHNLIAEDIFGVTISGSGAVIHHKDGNGTNNSLSNLWLMSRSRHMQIHSKQGWENKGNGERFKERDYSFMHVMNRQRKETWTKKDWREFSIRVSEGIKRKGGRKNEKNSMYGKTHTNETKIKISTAKKGKKINGVPWNAGLTKNTDQRVRNISKRLQGKVPYNKGVFGVYKRSQKSIEKQRTSMTGRKQSDAHKENESLAATQRWKSLKESGVKAPCAICGKQFTTISNTHLKYAHALTLEEYKQTYNHKITSIEFAGCEDVYNITVENCHNYATGAGVIIKNCYHLDPEMLVYLQDKTTDMHRDMGMRLYFLELEQIKRVKPCRQSAKSSFVFPQFYGDWWKSCAGSLWADAHLDTHKLDGIPLWKHLYKHGCRTLEDYEQHVRSVEDWMWNTKWPVYTQWKADWTAAYHKRGWFQTLTGFKCTGLMDRKQAINYPIQGSAFHIMLQSIIWMTEIAKERRWKSFVCNQIYDDMMMDVHPDEEQEVIDTLRYLMTERILEHWKWIKVPLEVEIEATTVNGTWYEKTEDLVLK